MLCYTLSLIDRQILSLLVGPIKRDLLASDTEIGLLGGLAFAVFYTLMGLPFGWMADRYSRRNVIAFGVAVWSVMTAFCSLPKTYLGLFFARTGVGVGEASLGPSAMSLIADYFPRERLSTALSIYSMGVFIGGGLALIVGGLVIQAISQSPVIDVPMLGEMASWRTTFLAVGFPGLLVALLLLTVREPQRKNALVAKDGQQQKLTVSEIWQQISLRWTSVIGIAVGMMFTSMCVYAFMFWTPTYMQRTHGWTPPQTGLAVGLTILVMGCIGMYIGGKWTDRWQRAGIREAALKVGMWSALGAFVAFVPAFLIPHSPFLSIALMAPGIALASMPTGSCYAALQMILPNQVRGQASAIFLFILNIGGLTLGPFLPGFFNDQLFHNEAMIGQSTALTIAIALIGAMLTFALTFKPYRGHHALMHPDPVAK
jgi:MFS family permease